MSHRTGVDVTFKTSVKVRVDKVIMLPGIFVMQYAYYSWICYSTYREFILNIALGIEQNKCSFYIYLF